MIFLRRSVDGKHLMQCGRELCCPMFYFPKIKLFELYCARVKMNKRRPLLFSLSSSRDNRERELAEKGKNRNTMLIAQRQLHSDNKSYYFYQDMKTFKYSYAPVAPEQSEHYASKNCESYARGTCW